LGEWTHQPGSVATEKKIYMGKGEKFYPKIKVGEFLIEAGSIKAGDTIMITGPRFWNDQRKAGNSIVNGTAQLQGC
jgi:putative protease